MTTRWSDLIGRDDPKERWSHAEIQQQTYLKVACSQAIQELRSVLRYQYPVGFEFNHNDVLYEQVGAVLADDFVRIPDADRYFSGDGQSSPRKFHFERPRVYSL